MTQTRRYTTPGPAQPKARSLRFPTLLLLGWIGLMNAAFDPARAQTADPAYVRQIDTWHAQREMNLKKETGWLSVVGLYPLHEGAQTFGSAADNDIVFPPDAPAHIGTMMLDTAGKIMLTAHEKSDLQGETGAVNEVEMVPDTRPNPTVLNHERFQFFVIQRGDNYFIRLKDRESDGLRKFTHIERFPIDPGWKIEARWEPYDPPKPVSTPNVLGYEAEESCPGAAVFELEGKTYRLEPTGDPEVGLFFVFGDATNEHETYGGGRFLYTDPPDSTGKVVIDFNMAYNPPCVFTLYATCPLPRAGDVLPFRVEAGEKIYGDH